MMGSRSWAALLICLLGSPAQAQSVVVPAYERTVLPNGMTVLIMPRRDVPLIAFAAIVKGGSRTDEAGKAGVASLAAGLLEKGAGERTAYEFADAVEGAGGSFGASAGSEATVVSGQFLAKDQGLMIELLADGLMRPRLEAAEFERLRARQIELIKAAKDADPSDLIRTYGRAFLFASHPYGKPQGGSEGTLASITHADVTAHYASEFGADRTTLIFAGDVDAGSLRRAVTSAFSKWPRAKAALVPLTAPKEAQGRRVLLVDEPGSAQTYFWIANVGVARNIPERAALDIVNALYGGRFTSILNTELRVKSGLSYGASSSFVRGSVPAEFAIRSFTRTEDTGKAIDLALRTLADLHAEGVSAEMIDSGRAYVLGQFPLQLETAAHWAAALSELELYGLDRSYIENYGPALAKVTLADTKRVIASAYPEVGDVVLVLIGDADRIREAAKKYGPVTEMPLAAPDFAPPGY